MCIHYINNIHSALAKLAKPSLIFRRDWKIKHQKIPVSKWGQRFKLVTMRIIWCDWNHILFSVGSGGSRHFWWKAQLHIPSHSIISLSGKASRNLHVAQIICMKTKSEEWELIIWNIWLIYYYPLLQSRKIGGRKWDRKTCEKGFFEWKIEQVFFHLPLQTKQK